MIDIIFNFTAGVLYGIALAILLKFAVDLAHAWRGWSKGGPL